jgi:hypothetical protein
MRHRGHLLNQVRAARKSSETGIKTVLLWQALARSNPDAKEVVFGAKGLGTRG